MTTKEPDAANTNTTSEERAQEHAAHSPHDRPHSRGEQRDADSQAHPAPQDQNQQMGREGVRNQVSRTGRQSK